MTERLAPSLPWRRQSDVTLLRVRLTPKGGRDSIDGLTQTPDGPAIKARVRTAPEDGAANAALEALIADWVGVPHRAVSLAAGHKSRIKTFAISGEPDQIAETLRAVTSALSS